MGRTKQIENDIPFVSIEKDARLLKMEVKHDGMSKREANELVKTISAVRLDADFEAIPGTGRKVYEREEKQHPPFASERYYTIEDASYQVNIFQGDRVIVIENRKQWELYKVLYNPTADAVKPATSNTPSLDEMFFAETGMSLKEAIAHMKRQESSKGKSNDKPSVESIEQIAESELFEMAMEEDDFEGVA